MIAFSMPRQAGHNADTSRHRLAESWTEGRKYRPRDEMRPAVSRRDTATAEKRAAKRVANQAQGMRRRWKKSAVVLDVLTRAISAGPPCPIPRMVSARRWLPETDPTNDRTSY